MNTDYKNIFCKDTCLTTNELTDYLLGNLSVNELRKVELHISDCQMCNDELEGLQNLNNIEKLPQIISSLNNKIDSHFNKNTFVLPLKEKNDTQKSFNFKKTFSIAASIALLITAGYFIFNISQTTTEKNLAQANITKENTVDEEIAIIEHAELENNIVENSYDKNIETEDTKNEEKVINKTSQIKNKPISNNEENSKSESAEFVYNDEIVDVSEEETSETELNDDISSENIIGQNKEVANSEKNNISFGTTRGGSSTSSKADAIKNYSYLKDSGILSYKIKSYKDAISDFSKYLAHYPNDFDIIYKIAMSYYFTNKYDAAISNFNKIISTQNIKYFEDAKWYKANALLQQNKKDDALILFKEIVTEMSKFSQKASIKISEIEN